MIYIQFFLCSKYFQSDETELEKQIRCSLALGGT